MIKEIAELEKKANYIRNHWGQLISIISSGAYHGIYFEVTLRK